MCLSILTPLGIMGQPPVSIILIFIISLYFRCFRAISIFRQFSTIFIWQFSVIIFRIFFSCEFFLFFWDLENVEDEVEDEDGFEMARRTPFPPLLTTVQHGKHLFP